MKWQLVVTSLLLPEALFAEGKNRTCVHICICACKYTHVNLYACGYMAVVWLCAMFGERILPMRIMATNI